MTADELDNLATDIAANDLIHPIVLFKASDGKPNEVLDGRCRLDAMATLADGEKRIRKALERPIYKAAPGCDPWKYVESVNDRRRHLMPEDRRERRERIARELKRGPQQSDRTIAKATGASPSTVGAERKEQEQIGMVSKLDTRVGRDGIAQPATKPQNKLARLRAVRERGSSPLANTVAPRLAQAPAAAIVANTAAPLLLASQIEDFCSGLKGQRTDVQRMDRQLRLRLARGLLAALGIAPAELVPAATGGGGADK
jgi:DNA-binding Lrp family transcriptional regulator